MTRLLLVLWLATSSVALGESPWLTDYAQAREVARKQNKPIFLVFRCDH